MTRLLHAFPGGLRLPSGKAESAASPVVPAGLPARLTLPLQQHVGSPSVPVVEPGARVRKGALLARPGSYVGMSLRAPTSGTVAEIAPRPIVHPDGIEVPAIVLEPDGADAWGEREPPMAWPDEDPLRVAERIEAAGIVGLGGAGFPTHVKLREGAASAVHTLIINGLECEPYITCDDRLLRERAAEVLEGARILAHAAQARSCVLAVKDDMIAAMAALDAAGAGGDVEIVAVPALYPAGGEKQLIRVLTGAEVPSGGLPIEVGVVMHNVATAAAVYRAVRLGEPLVSRLVTVAGAVARPGNYEVLLGTPVAYLIERAGGALARDARVVVGGPMMGVPVKELAAPVTKTANCVLVLARPAERPPLMPCIRCGACADCCPVRLQPQALFALARAGDLDGVQDLHLFDCIECGCCDYVCPSGIPLVAELHRAKAEIDVMDRLQARAHDARQRYEAHLARTAGASGGKAPEPADDTEARRAYVAAAVERVRRRRGTPGGAQR